MNPWFIFFLGLLIGWGIELLIDYFFWKRRLVQAYADCNSLRDRIEDLEAENRRLQGEIDTVESRTDCDSLRARIEDLEAENRRLRDEINAGSQLDDTRTTSIPLSEEPVSPDDLRKIEGIGVKIAQLLNAAGIYTFAQLAETEVAELRIILKEAGPRFQLADPSTWPEQAALAARGAWDELSELQDSLKGGRK